MYRLHRRISYLATWPVVALLLCGCVVCLACFQEVQKSLGHENEILDTRGWYTPNDVARLYQDLGDRRALYVASTMTIDVVFPLMYGLLLATFVVQLYASTHARFLLLLPLAGSIADLLENLTIAILMLCGPSSLSWFAAGLTAAKFALLLTSLILIAVGGCRGLQGRLP